MASQRATTCQLWKARHVTGLSFFPYAYLPFHGLYTEDGVVLRGTQGEAQSAKPLLQALQIPSKKNCCGQLLEP